MFTIPPATQEAILTKTCPALGVNPDNGRHFLDFNTIRVEKGRFVLRYNGLDVAEIALGDDPVEVEFSGVIDINIDMGDTAPEASSEVESVTT